MGSAGTALKDAREVAGVTLTELSSAIDLKSPDLLDAVEEGKAGLPFEMLLRLASFYARNDPIPFVMKYARTYSPGIWDVMETLGLDKLTLEAEREIQFLNIYRSHDAARQLSDEGFERVREFTQRAFEMALHFVAETENIDPEDNEDEAEGQT
jgi:transcriptional regulator with XRE-family HTH domain